MINFGDPFSFSSMGIKNQSFCDLDCLSHIQPHTNKEYIQTHYRDHTIIPSWRNIVNQEQSSPESECEISIECTFWSAHQKLALQNINNLATTLNIQLNTIHQQNQKILEYQFNTHQLKNSKQLHNTIQTHRKLREFLMILKENISEAIVADLQLASLQILLEYKKLRQIEIKEDELLQIRDKLMEGQLKEQLIKGISLFSQLNRTQTQITEINEFIKFYITTVLFIVEQFFINPYQQREQPEEYDQSQNQSYLDQFNDQSQYQEQESQQEGGLYGRKMRKTE